MHPMPVLCRHASSFVLILLLVVVASGCQKGPTPKVAPTPTPTPTPKLLLDLGCSSTGSKQVDVTATNGAGADPEIVYVCEDETVFWNANGHQFSVEFTGESPFKDEGKKFDNTSPYSGKSKHHDKHKYQLYGYQITVDKVQYDPQVIGGGNP